MMNNRTKHIDEPALEGNEPETDEIMDVSAQEITDSVKAPEIKEPKKRVGAILKEARENQGLSLEIVHEAIKIPLDALRAIEEGYTIRMLSPFYYSGFVKMYANYLNIDAAEVIENYKQEELPKIIEQNVEEIATPKWMLGIFTRQRKQQMVIAAGVLLALFLLFKIVGFLASREPKSNVEKEVVKKEVVKIEAVKKEIKKAAQKPPKKVRQQTPKIITPKKAPKVVVPVVPKPVKPVASAPPVVVQKNVNLTVRANQNSWLRVKTDGNVVFQSTLRTGAVETWKADSEIEISGRHINELEFELNGKMIGTLGRKDRNAKKVVITKNGLSVKR